LKGPNRGAHDTQNPEGGKGGPNKKPRKKRKCTRGFPIKSRYSNSSVKPA